MCPARSRLLRKEAIQFSNGAGQILIFVFPVAKIVFFSLSLSVLKLFVRSLAQKCTPASLRPLGSGALSRVRQLGTRHKILSSWWRKQSSASRPRATSGWSTRSRGPPGATGPFRRSSVPALPRQDRFPVFQTTVCGHGECNANTGGLPGCCTFAGEDNGCCRPHRDGR